MTEDINDLRILQSNEVKTVQWTINVDDGTITEQVITRKFINKENDN